LSVSTPRLAEVYGADVSRQTISTITDKVVEGMTQWQNRPAVGTGDSAGSLDPRDLVR